MGMTPTVGWHGPPPYWEDQLAGKWRIVKVLGNTGLATHLIELSQRECVVIQRNFMGLVGGCVPDATDDIGRWSNNCRRDPVETANAVWTEMQQVYPGMPRGAYVEGPFNEPNKWSPEEVDWQVACYTEFLRITYRDGYKAAVCSYSVGRPPLPAEDGSDAIYRFAPLYDKVKYYKGIVACHCYGGVDMHQLYGPWQANSQGWSIGGGPPVGGYLIGRWLYERYLLWRAYAEGITPYAVYDVPMVITEGGLDNVQYNGDIMRAYGHDCTVGGWKSGCLWAFWASIAQPDGPWHLDRNTWRVRPDPNAYYMDQIRWLADLLAVDPPVYDEEGWLIGGMGGWVNFGEAGWGTHGTTTVLDAALRAFILEGTANPYPITWPIPEGWETWPPVPVIATNVGQEEPEQPPEVEPEEPLGDFVVTADALNIRSGPGINYSKVGTHYKDQVVQVYEISEGWGRVGMGRWCSMEFLKEVGAEEPNEPEPEEPEENGMNTEEIIANLEEAQSRMSEVAADVTEAGDLANQVASRCALAKLTITELNALVQQALDELGEIEPEEPEEPEEPPEEPPEEHEYWLRNADFAQVYVPHSTHDNIVAPKEFGLVWASGNPTGEQYRDFGQPETKVLLRATHSDPSRFLAGADRALMCFFFGRRGRACYFQHVWLPEDEEIEAVRAWAKVHSWSCQPPGGWDHDTCNPAISDAAPNMFFRIGVAEGHILPAAHWTDGQGAVHWKGWDDGATPDAWLQGDHIHWKDWEERKDVGAYSDRLSKKITLPLGLKAITWLLEIKAEDANMHNDGYVGEVGLEKAS